MSNVEIIPVGQNLPALTNPAMVIQYAMEKGADIAHIEKLMELQMRWDADQARKAYVADMAEFKKTPPQIVKDKLVGYENKDGTTTGYRHATLGNVTSAIVEGLARHGFSHRWDTQQEGPQIVVTCILTHKGGHSERTTLSSTRDDSGKKNNIQAMGSAITYLQRYTLLSSVGLATHDDDGVSAGDLDVTLADEWIGKAKDAAALDALAKVWDDGAAAIIKADDGIAYQEFKTAVNARKAELLAKNPSAQVPGRPSRMAGIMAANATQVPLSPGDAPGRDDGLPPDPPWSEAAE